MSRTAEVNYRQNVARCARQSFPETLLRWVIKYQTDGRKDHLWQEEFESHVVEHFSYEESETLRNFDTVPDAFWPGIEHNPEM